jgi:uncharacterized membrane protein YdfJ with MMPL/SSD domain
MSLSVARALIAARHVVVALWIAATVAAVALLPTVEEAQTGALSDLVPADAEALDAEVRAADLFGFPLEPFRELALLMTVGVLVDEFVVRTLLVPAIIAWVGPAGAWPRRDLHRDAGRRASTAPEPVRG